MSEERQEISSAQQKVTMKIPIIGSEIQLNARLHSLLSTLSPLILVGLLVIIASVVIILVPTEGGLNQDLVITIIHFGIGLATPAMLGLIGEIIGQNSGTANLGLEGTMGVSAFFCFLTAWLTNNLILAIVVASVIGGLIALVHTYNVNYLNSNQAISGMGINLAMTGMGGFLYLAIFGAAITPPQIPILPGLSIPILADIPIWGFILFQQTALTYFAIIIAVAAEIVLNHSRLGMQIKAAGQNPEAAATAGINVNRVRVACSIFGGMLAGIGGGFLTLNTGFFAQYIINGRGWIAFALARLALPSPIIGVFTSLIFGFGLAIQFRIQALQWTFLPYEFLWMLPYIFTLIALFVYSIQQKRRRGE